MFRCCYYHQVLVLRISKPLQNEPATIMICSLSFHVDHESIVKYNYFNRFFFLSISMRIWLWVFSSPLGRRLDGPNEQCNNFVINKCETYGVLRWPFLVNVNIQRSNECRHVDEISKEI